MQQAQPLQVLDARSLGRPVHLLQDFAAHLRELLDEWFRQTLNRRYRANYSLGEITISPPGHSHSAGPWLSAERAQGDRISCLIERGLVLSVMTYRYGAQTGHASADAGHTPAETSTEERLLGLLGQQMLQGLATRLEATPADENVPALPRLSAAQRQAPGSDAWLITVPVQESQQGLETTLSFALDGAWMNRLLRDRAPARNKPAAPLPQGPELAAKLQLKLVARLLQTELPLGDLLDLRPGTVIPVSLKATDVLVDGSRLFTASVAEHQGKLCLTSFEDSE